MFELLGRVFFFAAQGELRGHYGRQGGLLLAGMGSAEQQEPGLGVNMNQQPNNPTIN